MAQAESGVPAKTVVHTTLNLNVRDLWYRFQRTIEEMVLSGSSNVASHMRDDDYKRMQQNLKYIRDAAIVATSAPQLDTPFTLTREYALEHWFDDKRMLENDDMDTIKTMLVTARDGLALSAQSNRLPNRLHIPDGERLIAMLDAIDTHVQKVTLENSPMDFPQTSPTREVSPAGRTGI
jgi:hypothetical protein